MGAQSDMNGHYRTRVEEVDAESLETAQEFDMGSDDGSSSSSNSSVPAKYDFYQPLPRSAQSGFVVRLDTWVQLFLSSFNASLTL